MSCNNKQKHRCQGGFTLVEIMIALVVFMVIMLGLGGGLLIAIRTNSSNVVRDEALRLAEDELTRLKGLHFSVMGVSDELAATAPNWTALAPMLVTTRKGTTTFARATQITDLGTTATALKRIDVAVGWNDPAGGALLAQTNKNRQTTLSTIVVRSDD
ncbi:MAG: prepilin-type N-terminal cleavage/methylation domain-containing protein [Deltaproteobacteria bacterium]|nr:prepilin-type N-terminal cleavage/methylation domain-containing protein [Deltaproteobacteria bacterium]